MTKTKTTKATTDSRGNELHLLVTEQREHGYFHLTARVVTQRLEGGQWVPYGVDDDYSDGLQWTGLQVRCQGDDRSRVNPDRAQAVYGYDVCYHDVYTVDLRKAKRHVKTLEKLAKGLDRITEVRGYVRSYGEYLGRVAEVLGCAGIGIQRSEKHAATSGQRWLWESIGDGVNAANNAIWRWQQEVVEREGAQGEAVAS
jgi:hypothetical protein